MEKRKKAIIVGSLFHDIGKLAYRYESKGNHSDLGVDFLRKYLQINDDDILEQVKYHHAASLKDAKIDQNSLAYITYIADNIASGADRRKDGTKKLFQKGRALESVFNILNNNDKNLSYAERTLQPEDIPYATESNQYSSSFYRKILNEIKDSLGSACVDHLSCNSILKQLEKSMTYIPSSTATDEKSDISLYDHVKMTAAISSCIFDYLESINSNTYRESLYKNSEQFYTKRIFLMYSMDLSGIQSFIYTTSSKGGLKALRCRSFYLEILMEYMIDMLLERLELSRANLLYSGGGHAYLLLPNTRNAQEQIKQYEEECNKWFLEVFQTALYMASGFSICTGNDLMNKKNKGGNYSGIFENVSKSISKKKGSRYTAVQIQALNQSGKADGERECKCCHRVDHLYKDENDEYQCIICGSIQKFSAKIMKNEVCFGINKEKKELQCLPMPFGRFLHVVESEKLERQTSTKYEYLYKKNKITLEHQMTNIWVGDYQKRKTFEELAKESRGFTTKENDEKKKGIRRLAVLRADVDNLGHAFTRGLEHEKYDDQYVTISRTATFSRSMSLFFKLYINEILKNGVYYINGGKEDKKRECAIVYSGGDDVFVIGSWDDIIGFAVDLHDKLKEYTEGTLTISAGIGLYPEKYPISVMARETGELEQYAKDNGKNAVTLFSSEHCYSWDVFIEQVLGEKLQVIQQFFNQSEERGQSFLYHLLELLRNREESINLARYAYLLSRMQPVKDATQKEKESYRAFSEKMYEWMKNKDGEDARQAITAITLYAYLNRAREEEKNDE